MRKINLHTLLRFTVHWFKNLNSQSECLKLSVALNYAENFFIGSDPCLALASDDFRRSVRKIFTLATATTTTTRAQSNSLTVLRRGGGGDKGEGGRGNTIHIVLGAVPTAADDSALRCTEARSCTATLRQCSFAASSTSAEWVCVCAENK